MSNIILWMIDKCRSFGKCTLAVDAETDGKVLLRNISDKTIILDAVFVQRNCRICHFASGHEVKCDQIFWIYYDDSESKTKTASFILKVQVADEHPRYIRLRRKDKIWSIV